MSDFTHFNSEGHAHMVDIGDKLVTHRVAIAEGMIQMSKETFELIQKKGHKKGDVLQVARIAAIMAAKKTAELIPLCHPIPITHINIDFEMLVESQSVRCLVRCETTDKTGIEMEALTACNLALLTVYDMCKAVDKAMIINGVRLLEKSGGRSGHFKAAD